MIFILLCAILLIGCKSNDFSAQNEYEIKGNTATVLKNTKLSLVINNIEHMQEVKPENPYGYYNYYKDEEGYYYCVVSGIIKNPEQQVVNSERFEVKAKNNNKKFDTKFAIEDSARSTLIFGEDTVSKEVKFHIVSLVKDGEESPNEFLLYYQNDLKENSENNRWENALKIIW